MHNKQKLLICSGIYLMAAVILAGCTSSKSKPLTISDTKTELTAPDNKAESMISETISESTVTEVISEAASPNATSVVSSFEMQKLEPGITYYYDMDFDGTNEKILFTISTSDPWKEKPKLFINDNECNYATEQGDGRGQGALYILDLDTIDNRLELHFRWTAESDTLSIYNFMQYSHGAMIDLGDLSYTEVLSGMGNLFRISDEADSQFPGDGTFLVLADTPYYSDTIGCYYLPIQFRLSAGSIVEEPSDTYSLTLTNPPFEYVAVSAFVTSSQPRLRDIAFYVEPGQSVTIDSLAFFGDIIYARATNTDGQQGWFITGQELFENVPAWG